MANLAPSIANSTSNYTEDEKPCSHLTKVYRKPNDKQRCTYQVGMPLVLSPHRHKPLEPRKKIMESILDAVGNTPLVRCSRISNSLGIKCEILAKCEFLSAGGSVKDRIGVRMVEEAELDGWLQQGDTLIEPTSGNTGIGIALTAAVRGYRCIITLPEKMSKEKVDVLRALGAEVVRTPTEAAHDAPESLFGVARRLQQTIPRAHILDQYTNPGNPLAHYDSTAEEIIEACEGRVDMLVLSAGTGGTLTGLVRKFREKCPNCRIIAVDPDGSSLALPRELNKNGSHFYEVEGIGYDFDVTTCEKRYVDRWYKSFDKPSLECARRLIREEGFLCGGSSGAAFHYAVQALRDFGLADDPSKRCVVLLPDGIRNYMTKFVSDEWMLARDFLDVPPPPDESRSWWWYRPVSVLKLQAPKTLSSSSTLREALDTLSKFGFDQMPVIDDEAAGGNLRGVVTTNTLLAAMLTKARASSTDSVLRALYRKFITVPPNAPLGKVSVILEAETFVLVAKEEADEKGTSKKKLLGAVTSIDLLHYVAQPQENGTHNGTHNHL